LKKYYKKLGFQGNYEIKIVLDDSKIPSFIPPGRYRVDYNLTIPQSQIYSIRTEADVKSNSRGIL
jgi:hypothetical protein